MPTPRTTIYSVVLALGLLHTSLSHAQPPTDTSPRIVALDPRWTVKLSTPPAAAPGFDQQSAYVPLAGGDVLAIDLDEGRVAWTLSQNTSFTPATGDGMVFLASGREVMAIEQHGKPLWRITLPAEVSAPLHWDSGWVLASTAQGELVALRAEDGSVLWQAAIGSPIVAAPSVSGDRVYVALADGRVAALRLESGDLLWAMALEHPVTGLLALEEQLVVGTRGNRLHSIATDRGRLRWTQKAGADVIGAPIVDDSTIYFVAFDNVLRALNRGNGNLRWRRNLPSRPSGGALRADDVVLVPFSTNAIGAYTATSGAAAFTIQAVGELGGAPFLRDGARPTAPRLIAISREGALQGFAERIEPPPVPLAELPGMKVGG